jgi:AraC-like DNA-binding protein
MSRPDSYYVVSNPYPSDAEELLVLFAGHSQTKPGHKVGPKVVDYYLMHHVLSGKGYFTCRGEEYVLGAGDSFLIEPDQLVGYVSDEEDPWHYRWIAFQGKQSGRLLASAGFTPQQPVVHTGRDRRVGALFRQIENAFRGKRRSASLKATGYLHLLLSVYSDALQPGNASSAANASEIEKTVQQAIHYLSTQYAEAVSIEMMAETLGYNRAYLSKLFKKATGMTPVTFLLRLRLDKARHLLRERMELTTGQIAASVGFQDPLYFSKQFKRLYGQSPTEYRNTVKGF